ncbi:MAG TPA: hypothetical protein VF658_17725 [Pyrinomonadaceae bacterium]|jgi:hypothetical protein
MAIRKRSRRARLARGGNNSGESEYEARLAPLEEKRGAGNTQSSNNDGTLAVNTGDLKLPQDLTEEEEEVHSFFPIDPFVFATLCFALLFILTIAYVIWSGWEPSR